MPRPSSPAALSNGAGKQSVWTTTSSLPILSSLGKSRTNQLSPGRRAALRSAVSCLARNCIASSTCLGRSDHSASDTVTQIPELVWRSPSGCDRLRGSPRRKMLLGSKSFICRSASTSRSSPMILKVHTRVCLTVGAISGRAKPDPSHRLVRHPSPMSALRSAWWCRAREAQSGQRQGSDPSRHQC
ncbi:MAG: hypothetical protein ACI80N_002931 [Gammaproteobacteria bacterium]|jgi:hypothetical protein